MNFSKIQSFSMQLKSNKIFELFVIGIIVFSALVIGAKTHDISSSVMKVINLLDWLITFIFLFELVIRFIQKKIKSVFFIKHGMFLIL